MVAVSEPTAGERYAFFTDTTVCIGCKACEVACKEWNSLPDQPFAWVADSYDQTGELNADNWRHVAFIEQRVPEIRERAAAGAFLPGDQLPAGAPTGDGGADLDITRVGTGGFAAPIDGGVEGGSMRWLMSSDVCKHCTTAACLDVCPTGSLFKTEFDTVVVQPDICNGCGYCVPACPYGVIDRRPDDGRVFKCTMCYDRLKAGQKPACEQACPTDSINVGTLDEMQAMARDRLDEVVEAGALDARVYGEVDGDGAGVDGTGALFLLLDEPEVYGLPPDPIAGTRDLPSMWRAAAAAAGVFALAAVSVFAKAAR